MKSISKLAQSIIEREDIAISVDSEKIQREENTTIAEDIEYKSVDYKSYLKVVSKYKMDELFNLAYNRRMVSKYVRPLSNKDSLQKVAFPMVKGLIPYSVYAAVLSTSARLIKYVIRNTMGRRPYSTINMILDTNCSLRKGKLRLRTIVTSILITVMKELGIPFNLYVFCGRYRGVIVTTENQSVHNIISFLFDMEEVVKMPSTPLDLLTLKKQFDEKDPVVIVSDGFSEQMMSEDNEVKRITNKYRNLFLVLLYGRQKESLSEYNRKKLLRALKINFSSIIKVSRISDLSCTELCNMLFDKRDMNLNTSEKVVNASILCSSIDISSKQVFNINKSVVSISPISSTKSAKMVDINDEELLVCPRSNGDSTVLRKLNGVIQGENLFDAMSISLFVPNKSTAYIAATSGTSIHMANYIKYVVSKTGDGKFFKKLGSEKIRSYNASMQLPCIDVWVATKDVIRVATGISSMDLWESNIVATLYESLLSPCQNTCLPDCIRYACCTCNARSFQSVMMILTNGVLCNESRFEIKSIVCGIEMTYLGIGIGLYLCGFEDLFPTMIWNSNPIHLSETILNLSNPSTSGNFNAVPEKSIDGMIWNGTFKKTYSEMTERICSIPSIYETTLSSVRFNDATDGKDAMKRIGDINDSKYDLGVDGAFGHYTILFIILYLCRGEKDDNGRVIDEFITEEVLRNGKTVQGSRFSPILKLGDKIINGKHIGKGFDIHYAYDYKSAINKLMSGKYRIVFITCSPGDGIMAKKCDEDVDQYANAFVSCVHEFNMRGGGVFWFLENYPFTYEADLYFKKFYGFEAVGDKDKTIKGGKVMKRVKEKVPEAGHFITIGGDALDFSNLSRLDFGIISIFEGKTLCKLDENELEGIGFRIFARESEGNASIMVKERQEGRKEGRMIIDTAASKLFLEFTEDGTARWISNAAVWLCNTEEYEEERFLDPSITSGIKMDKVCLPGKNPMEKREAAGKKQVNFCLSIVIDTTGSMDPYINATRDNIVTILNNLKKIEREYHILEGGIVGQVVQYKDFNDVLTGDRNVCITSDFNRLKSQLASFVACGGGDACEDIQGGLIRALDQMEQSKYINYNHLILIVADANNHEDGNEGNGCDYSENVQYNTSFAKVWEMIYKRVRTFNSIRIMFMPVSNSSLEKTAKIMEKGLGNKIVTTAPVTTETNFVEVVTKTAINEYKRIIGIS